MVVSGVAVLTTYRRLYTNDKSIVLQLINI